MAKESVRQVPFRKQPRKEIVDLETFFCFGFNNSKVSFIDKNSINLRGACFEKTR
jgi:hypothetical protein